MNESRILAPPRARHGIWLLGALVLALHLLALGWLSLPEAGRTRLPERRLHTRVLAAPPAPARAAAPAQAAPEPPRAKAAPPARPAPARKRAPSKPQAIARAPAPAPAAAAADTDLHDEAGDDAAYEAWLAELAAARGSTLASADAAAPTHTDGAGKPHPEADRPARPADTPQATDPAAAAETAAAAASGPAQTPAPTPTLSFAPPTRLRFDVSGHVKGFDYRARGELLWLTDGQHYSLRQQISALFLGSRAQQSEGLVGAGGLQPQHFVDEARKDRSAELDFAAGVAHFSDGASPQAPISAGAQDRMSVFLQLGAMIAAAPADYPPGSELAFETVGARRVDRWVFRVIGPQLLSLPAGETPALKLQRLPQPGDDQVDELWLGSALHYLPVRIRLAQGGGDHVDLQLLGHETP
ncbi:DUF3108 domain-containing protein [Comamonas flocculans]|uniref:DUF3108 domain-containing protein n=1 Tax=Comamonas flocculans TaxID=2597701 RepID=A0A5B8RSK0_9BURK|nr:DUF3108 domain-containing protein [Comamonas flocculans]QEA12639.1 DUF3108 domain-containing protein [Comamonas flocculans]